MKHCESLDIEVTPKGAVFKGKSWPHEIKVERGLLDYLPGPHVIFGRAGILRFTCTNGYALYRRREDIPGGWTYELKEYHLHAAPEPAEKTEPAPLRVAKLYRRGHNGSTVEAFQWLPNGVPPVELPEWFLRSDFQHVAVKGQLVLRNPTGLPVTTNDGDFVVRDGNKIFPLPAKAFVEQYQEVGF